MQHDHLFYKLDMNKKLTRPKIEIDLTNPKRDQIDQFTAQVLVSLHRAALANLYTEKYITFGSQEHLDASYRPEWAKLGCNYAAVKSLVKKDKLSEQMRINAEFMLTRFRANLEEDPYRAAVYKLYEHNRAEFAAHYPDVKNTYPHAVDQYFAEQQCNGFSYEVFSSRTAGYLKLLGALRQYDPSRFRNESVGTALHQAIVDCGCSFQDNFIRLPNEGNVYQYGKYGELSWTPERVHEQTEQLHWIIELVPEATHALEHALPDYKIGSDPKVQCQLVENSYNLNKVVNRLLHTTCYLIDQQVEMIKHFRPVE